MIPDRGSEKNYRTTQHIQNYRQMTTKMKSELQKNKKTAEVVSEKSRSVMTGKIVELEGRGIIENKKVTGA